MYRYTNVGMLFYGKKNRITKSIMYEKNTRINRILYSIMFIVYCGH